MIQINLKLFVTLVRYLPPNNDKFNIKEGTTVEMLIKDLGIPEDSVKLIFVDGKKQDKTYCLKNNERIGLFPPVGGG